MKREPYGLKILLNIWVVPNARPKDRRYCKSYGSMVNLRPIDRRSCKK